MNQVMAMRPKGNLNSLFLLSALNKTFSKMTKISATDTIICLKESNKYNKETYKILNSFFSVFVL